MQSEQQEFLIRFTNVMNIVKVIFRERLELIELFNDGVIPETSILNQPYQLSIYANSCKRIRIYFRDIYKKNSGPILITKRDQNALEEIISNLKKWCLELIALLQKEENLKDENALRTIAKYSLFFFTNSLGFIEYIESHQEVYHSLIKIVRRAELWEIPEYKTFHIKDVQKQGDIRNGKAKRGCRDDTDKS